MTSHHPKPTTSQLSSNSKDQPDSLQGFRLACLLGTALLILSFARLVGDMNSAAFSFVVVEGALTDPLWKTRLGLNITLFFAVTFALHLAFGMTCWLLSLISTRAFPALAWNRRHWTLVWFFFGFLWLMIANATHFPRSSYGEPYSALASTRVLGTTPYILITATLLLAIVTVGFLSVVRESSWPRRKCIAATVVVAVTLIAVFAWRHISFERGPQAQSPHIVLLGIDSLRPDLVTAETTPNVLGFMIGATQFTDTITPLARTFPAWVSILTGRHPHTTGATMNLLPREHIRTGTTLPELLRQRGYRTYYAIDETRFSNIDSTYGFDETATPAIGASDFVLAWFGDTPLTNLIANTRIGAILFPHLYSNRAAHVIYDPDTFVHRIGRSFDFSQPSFLAVHLTLPHWPYTWATSSATDVDESNTEEMYRASIHRADQQFGDLLALLEDRGVLENAIVVTLSDHGEALGHTEDFLADAFPNGHEEHNKFQRWGHGTSVFSPTQYRVVLGIKAYGQASTLLHQPARLNAPVSLLDIAPTILDLLKLEDAGPFDGISLTHLLRAEPIPDTSITSRIRFTETEYNPQGFNPMKVEESQLALAAKVYRLDADTDRITVRTGFMESIMANRQYAALLDEKAGMAIPTEHGYQFIYVADYDGSRTLEDDRLAAANLKLALEDRFNIKFGAESGLIPAPHIYPTSVASIAE